MFPSCLQKKEGMQLVRDAIAAGIFNDLGSGSYVDLCVITKDKVEYLRPFDEANEKGRRLVSLVIFVSLYHPLLYVFIRISISSISTGTKLISRILSSSVSICLLFILVSDKVPTDINLAPPLSSRRK